MPGHSTRRSEGLNPWIAGADDKDVRKTLDRLDDLLLKEAIRQQWYDYTTDDQGQRHLILDHEH